ncbi:MAG TPA: metallophosphoesterase [Lentisphaeria bacterium]|nr:metallophosphoesterase [Lentisphaeria bacterium]
MLLFFFVAICGINIYNWWKLRVVFLQGSPWGSFFLLIAFLALAIMPAWLRVLFRSRGHVPDWLEQLAWIWLAWAFWLTAVFLALEFWNLIALFIWNFRAGRNDVALADLRSFALSPKATVAVAVTAVFLATAWGIVEAQCITLKHLTVTTDKLPHGTDDFRVLLLSDLHIGPALSQRRLRRVINLAADAKSDLILSAGDLVDGKAARERDLARQLAEISAPHGKIACIGNHDVYTGVDAARDLHDIAGFTLLEDTGVWATDWLWVAGPVDPAYYYRSQAASKQPPPNRALLPTTSDDAPANPFAILLKHHPEPEPEPENQATFDLQLSGHTHGGQIFPFNILVHWHHSWKSGRLHQLPTGTLFYISRGTGVWGPPFRLFSPPEMTVITLKRP